MIGGYFAEAGLQIGFETLPGIPVRLLVGNAQAMSSLQRRSQRLKWMVRRDLRDSLSAVFCAKIGLELVPQPDALWCRSPTAMRTRIHRIAQATTVN